MSKKNSFFESIGLICPIILIFILSAMLLSNAGAGKNGEDGKIIRIEELDLANMIQGYGQLMIKKSIDKNLLTIGGVKFEHGVGTHAISRFTIDLKGVAKSFQSKVGLDDEASTKGKGSVCFRVYADKIKVYDSGILKGKNPPKDVDVDLTNAKRLDLVVTDAGDFIDWDHADWADARLIIEEDSSVIPESIPRPVEPIVILTPKEKDTPKINSPGIIGAGENRDFLFYIPITGKRPLKIKAEGLPAGLLFDFSTGIITGKTGSKGKYMISIAAENSLGKDSQKIEIVIGEGLAKTPPMGWNSWNCWGCSVDDAKTRAAADALVKSGLINHGWTYINIDDCWQGARNKDTGEITSNEKFPDMKNLADYIHSLGLKFGVYTDAGTKTCAGYEGTKGHDALDAKTYAKWGVDYVKIDWCNTEGMEPIPAYTLFGNALRECGRDIVFSICNWGVQNPWEWGRKVGGNMWRTTGDIVDLWGSVYMIGSAQAPLYKYAGPGHWNDPDMLVVGKVGWGPKLRDSRLSPNEQYSHISLWCLLSAPLILGCDLSQLDDFTMNLLTNDEVLAIDQDNLGSQAQRIVKDEKIEVWAKDLSDGSKAVGIFNVAGDYLDETTQAEYTLSWDLLKIKGPASVRDLWQQKDLGEFKDSFAAQVKTNGVKLLKITPDYTHF